MKLTLAVTMDGLVRALRWKAHDLAEAAQAGRAPGARDMMQEKPARPVLRRARGEDDDRRGR